MATQAHCAYCFDTLSSHLSKTQALSLSEVEELWKRWNNGSPLPVPATEPPDITIDAEDADADADLSTLPDDTGYRPAAISRLLAASPSTASSSSVQSTASTPSAASSATSKSSSNSSFFGLGKRLKSAVRGDDEDDDEGREEHPLFVTWNVITRHGERRLRGCIGTFEALGLGEGLSSYALTSCVHLFPLSLPLSPASPPFAQTTDVRNAAPWTTPASTPSPPLNSPLSKSASRSSRTSSRCPRPRRWTGKLAFMACVSRSRSMGAGMGPRTCLTWRRSRAGRRRRLW